MLSKITLSNALLGSETAGSKPLWQAAITGLFVGAARFLFLTGLAIYLLMRSAQAII
jgi:hypothetical protein